MNRTNTARADLVHFCRAVPFRPFAVNLENGDRVIVEHPENIAFDGAETGDDWLLLVSDGLRHFTSLSAVTSVSSLVSGQLP